MDEAQVCARLYGMLAGHIELTGSPTDVLYDDDARNRLSLTIPDAFVLAEHLRAAGLPVPQGAPIEVVAEALCPS
ncbi:MAG: hypothetical protein PVSMB1_13720 [Gemmatimonadaceae bacterium]